MVFFHRLGDEQAQDRQVFAVTDHPLRTPEVRVTEDGKYLVIVLDEGTLTNGISVMDLATGRVDKLFDAYDGLYSYLGSRRATGGGTELLFLTTAGAPRGRIIAANLALTGATRLRTLVPESGDVLQIGSLVGDRVIAAWLTDAHSRVGLFDAADGKRLRDVELPGLGSVTGFPGENDDVETWFSYADFSTPTRIYSLDLHSGATRLLREPRFAADVSRYVTEQVFYPGKDGTRIPMFIVHRRDVPRDARTPLMLYGYGGFDISMTPSFAPSTVAWLEMGGIYAVANLRGGGEYGAAWHIAGTRTKKQTVFDDFIARGRLPGAREVDVAEAPDDPRRQQRRPAGRRRAHATAGALRRGAAGRGRARHAALPPRQRECAIVGGRLRPLRDRARVPRAAGLFTAAERGPARLLSPDAGDHRRAGQPRGAVAQLQVHRGAAGRAALREARAHPRRDAGRARQRQADVDAGGALRAAVGVRRRGHRHAAGTASAGAAQRLSGRDRSPRRRRRAWHHPRSIDPRPGWRARPRTTRPDRSAGSGRCRTGGTGRRRPRRRRVGRWGRA